MLLGCPCSDQINKIFNISPLGTATINDDVCDKTPPSLRLRYTAVHVFSSDHLVPVFMIEMPIVREHAVAV